MTIAELLKQLGLDDETVAKIEQAMAENKLYTTETEGVDKLYTELQGKYETLGKTNASAQELIKKLKSGGDPEEQKGKITAYEAQIEELKQEAREKQLEGEIKVALLTEKAKPDDIDYLIFQLRKSETDLSINDKGQVRGLDDAVKSLKTAHPGNFDEGGTAGGPKPLPNPLPKGGKPTDTEPATLADAIRAKYEPTTE